MINRKSHIPVATEGYPVQVSQLGQTLAASILFSCLLVLARMAHTGRLTFVFLFWNLFLACVPLGITRLLMAQPRLRKTKKFLVLFVLLWLLCIPNSFYIMTDLFHLSDWYNDFEVPPWYDLVLILSFVWNGLMLGILSVRQMEKILGPYLRSSHDLVFLYPVMWVNALGVYAGRYLRFNSWDVLTSPFALVADLGTLLRHPVAYRYAWAMIGCFSVLLSLIYLTLKRIATAVR